MTDFHSHILPFMDDGAENTDVSLTLLRRLRSQGVTRVYLTPHFLPGERTESFLSRREEAYRRLLSAMPEGEKFPELCLGAEVALCRGLSSTDLSPLALGDLGAILIELPSNEMTKQLWQEFHSCTADQLLTPMIAHLDRYDRLPRAALDRICELPDAVIQFNCDALKTFRGRRLIRRAAKSGVRMVFGSDTHNADTRPPRFELLTAFLRKDRAGVLCAIEDGEAFLSGTKTRKSDVLSF